MKAKQSLFVPAMILMSWSVLRWQTIENSLPSVQANVEEGYSVAIPPRIFIEQTESLPTLLSRTLKVRQVEKERLENSRPDRAQMIGFKPVRITRAIPKLSVLPRAPESLAASPVEASLLPIQPMPQKSIATDAVPQQPSARFGNISVSYWMLWRNRANRSDLLSNGQIGASQSGIRLLAPIASYRSALQLRLSARLSQSLQQGETPEGSIGTSLSVGKRIPVELIAERRLKLGQSSDSAWSLTAATGLSEFKLTQRSELDGYVQFGIVGARSRRPFIGGNAIVSRPLFDSDRNKVRVGVGIWGDAQRGTARLDIGPDLTLKTSMAGSAFRLSGQWRIRVAGEARPSSGPAIVVGSDF